MPQIKILEEENCQLKK